MKNYNEYDYFYGETKDNIITLRISNIILPFPLNINEIIESSYWIRHHTLTQIISPSLSRLLPRLHQLPSTLHPSQLTEPFLLFSEGPPLAVSLLMEFRMDGGVEGFVCGFVGGLLASLLCKYLSACLVLCLVVSSYTTHVYLLMLRKSVQDWLPLCTSELTKRCKTSICFMSLPNSITLPRYRMLRTFIIITSLNNYIYLSSRFRML